MNEQTIRGLYTVMALVSGSRLDLVSVDQLIVQINYYFNLDTTVGRFTVPLNHASYLSVPEALSLTHCPRGCLFKSPIQIFDVKTK